MTMAKLDKNKWLTEKLEFIRKEDGLYVFTKYDSLEKLPDDSITKWLLNKLDSAKLE